MASDEFPPWDDPYWLIKSDNAWQRGLRLQQGWWREAVLGDQSPGRRYRKRAEPLTVSMLPVGVKFQPNLLTNEAETAATVAIENLRDPNRPGMIFRDRLQRNLLSSQPLCFNLFGHLSKHSNALLPWVQTIAKSAAEVERVDLEWGPTEGKVGGSAFDAFVQYRRQDGGKGFLGIECKYAENLKATLTKPSDAKWRTATAESKAWRSGASSALDKTGLRQFWYNQLLTQIVQEQGGYSEAFGVVVACAADAKALEAVKGVRAQLKDPSELTFSSIEDVLKQVTGQRAWKTMFRERYVDFTPINDLLSPGDPRRVAAVA